MVPKLPSMIQTHVKLMNKPDLTLYRDPHTVQADVIVAEFTNCSASLESWTTSASNGNQGRARLIKYEAESIVLKLEVMHESMWTAASVDLAAACDWLQQTTPCATNRHVHALTILVINNL
jgi:hypothetical protein